MPAPIRISVLADAAQARREMNDLAGTTEKSTGRLKGALGKVGKYAALGLGAGVVVAAAAAKKFATAAIEDEQSANRMAQTFTKAAGATKGQIAATEDWITKQGKALGVADDELRPALSRLVTSTKDVGEAQKLTSLAMDISAGTGKSLESVSTALMKANNGQVSSLSRLGINTKDAAGKTITMAEATKRMTDTFGGAAQANAETLGGKVDRLKLLASETGEAIGGKMLPILTTLAGWILSTGVPAITEIAGRVQEWASSMAERLAPVASQVAAFVMGTLVPAITALAGYIMRTVVPAVVAFATKIGGNLAPVAIALVGHVQRLIAKFREWGPTIADVIAKVAKIVGKIIEFASVILGTVLPPIIRFNSALVVGLIGAIIKTVSFIVNIITKVIEFGGTVADGAGKVVEFAGTIKRKIGDVVGFFTSLPGKVRGALSGAAEWLIEAGKDIIRGLIAGLDTAKQWVIDKVKEIADVVPGWVKRRLGIASPAKVMIPLGRHAVAGLRVGLTQAAPTLVKASKDLAEKIIDNVQARIESATGVRDSILSLRDSIAGTLTGDLFGGTGDEEGTALDKFRATLGKAKAQAEEVAASVRKLLDAKVSGSFINKLVSSGNTELIVQLAGAPDVSSLAASYEAVVAQNEDTGRLVAETVIGTRLDDVNANLVALGTDLRAAEAQRRADEAAARAADKAERQAERAADKAERLEDKKKGQKVEVTIDSTGVDQLARGRGYKADIRAYENAGGR